VSPLSMTYRQQGGCISVRGLCSYLRLFRSGWSEFLLRVRWEHLLWPLCSFINSYLLFIMCSTV
jgi:hypothetical protein